jgi:hypothetical protein
MDELLKIKTTLKYNKLYLNVRVDKVALYVSGMVLWSYRTETYKTILLTQYFSKVC